MKRTPKNHHDLVNTVLCVSLPGLDHNAHVVLIKIAQHASADGTGSRPTYDFLRSGPDWGDTHIRNLLRNLEELKLIECTHRGRGKNNASVWRICREHPAYPDTYPTLKLTDTDEWQKTTALTTTPKAVNRHSEPGLSPLLDELTDTHKWQPSLHSSIHTPTPTPPPPANPETAPIAANKPCDFEELVCMYRKAEDRHPDINPGHKKKLFGLLKANPEEVRQAWRACIQEAPWSSYKEPTTHPFRFLLDAYGVWVAKSKEPPRQKITPELEAATDAAMRVAHAKVWHTPAQEPEPDLAELFSDVTAAGDGEEQK